MSALTEAQKKACDAFASATKSALSTVLNSLAPTQNADYPKPHVQEAPSDSLDPLLGNPSGVHVEVVYPSMTSSDFIGLSFNGNDTFEVKNGSLFGKVTFLVPVADVTLAVGKTIQVIYAVVRPDGVILSEILNLIVQPIAADKLPTPQITQASEDVLDLTTFDGGGDVTVEAWPLIAVGQTVWLTLIGTMVDGSRFQLNLLDGYIIGQQEILNGIALNIPQVDLERLKDSSELTLTIEVGFGKSPSQHDAMSFPVLRLKVSALLETFEFIPVQSTSLGGSIDTPFLEIALVSGSTSAIVSVVCYPTAAPRDIWYLHYNDNESPSAVFAMELRLKSTYAKVSFRWYGQASLFEAYDKNRILLSSQRHPSVGPKPIDISFSNVGLNVIKIFPDHTGGSIIEIIKLTR
ncbi:hypothetical protein QN399_03785 [Pseudomonas sp. 10C3]|uniref:hypothetical protein n=1 Tax=Pseudomonas sp. 10C3 TaxID=3118753 RepID=UPI002E81FEAB|nr:hypothetical protein [Pseudomonas sp. 10C3]MEE3505392.1 hypothetical protein [Pseudomonas sp. 10C3]